MAVSSIVSAAWPILGLFLLSLPLSLGLFNDHCALGQTSSYAKDSFVFRMIVAKAWPEMGEIVCPVWVHCWFIKSETEPRLCL